MKFWVVDRNLLNLGIKETASTSYLFFEDDFILFCHKGKQAMMLHQLLHFYRKYLGHRVNSQKTQRFFSHNTRVEIMDSNSNVIGFNKVDDLGIYFEMLFHKKGFRSKLSGWDAKGLSTG
ncbi:hypothetical protein PVK06_042334 [Gossypium arboreum]|uniref:Reverse transcriptase domain-containing protein n=1 Tax=Gossypium arboreum TaxID=29729 RepID=A0ABR0MKF3_GOSAR|nr:hypothetical protein PVK06_042334 [Gossypium arboreum]